MEEILRPQLLYGWAIFQRSDGAVVLARDRRLVIKQSPEPTLKLLQLLDGQHTSAEIERQLVREHPGLPPGWTRRAVQNLRKHRAIVDAAIPVPQGLTPQDLIRYDRQLAFLGEFECEGITRYDYQLRLKRARVLALGLGGLASWVLYTLAGAGVGEIIGIDGDVVEETNLNRQILYTISDLGKKKSEVAKERLQSLNQCLVFNAVPRMIDSEAALEPYLPGVDLLLLMADYPYEEIRRWVTSACLRFNIPYLIVFNNWIGPLCLPYKTACYGCYEAVVRQNEPFFDELAAKAGQLAPLGRRTRPGVISIIGGFVAWEALKHLAGFVRPAIYDGLIAIDPFEPKIVRVPLPRRPDCRFCSTPNGPG